MARRKGIIVTSDSSNEFSFDEAVGFIKSDFLRETLEERIDFQLDFEAIVRRSGQDIPQETRDDIASDVKLAALCIAMDHIKRVDDKVEHEKEKIPSRAVSERDFLRLSQKIERKAQELTALVDELMEIEPGLACRPRDRTTNIPKFNGTKDFINSLVGSNYRINGISEADFMEYFSFRRYLDYFANFLRCNAPYNNAYSIRFRYEFEYDHIELLVRRILGKLSDTNFPVGVAVPTDTNPNYESPIISVLLEILGQLKDFFQPQIDSFDLPWRDLNYRQLCYLASMIFDDFIAWDEAYLNVRRNL